MSGAPGVGHLRCMKKLDAFKLSLLAASVAGLGVGCATSEHADHDVSRASVTVSALSFTPETRADYVNKFPFYDRNWQMRDINTYTFAVPDHEVHVASTSDLPQFSENLPPGTAFVESAGGAGEVRTGLVIQHSPMLNR